jgi:hypothetical protein
MRYWIISFLIIFFISANIAALAQESSKPVSWEERIVAYQAEYPELPFLKLSKKLREHFLYLIDPENELVFGYGCYYSGTPPAARKRCFRLLERKRTLAFRYILRFGTPESKLYAVESLYLLKAWGYDIPEKDALLIEQVLSSKDYATICNGCMVYSEQMCKALTQMNLDRVEVTWAEYKNMGWVR